MGALLGTMVGSTVVGSTVAGLGFVLMRNPMRLALLAPGAEGYCHEVGPLATYRPPSSRGFRVAVRTRYLRRGSGWISESAGLRCRVRGTFGAYVVVCSWARGFLGGVLFVVQSIRGWSVDRPRLLRRGAELGPMAVFPPGTPAMEKEARSFNVAFRALLGTAVRAGLYHG